MTTNPNEHLQIFDRHTIELQWLIFEGVKEAQGKSREEAAQIYLDYKKRLMDLAHEQSRALQYMLGQPLEPKQHYGEGVLVGVFGAGLPQVSEPAAPQVSDQPS